MLEMFDPSISFQWVTSPPCIGRSVALLIPQYNESSRCDITARLLYFQSIVDDYHSDLDLILIDDGSTDDSLLRIMEFTRNQSKSFFVASVFPNANKVGALFSTTFAIKHKYVILSDFDTDLQGIKNLFDRLELFERDDNLMGCYFRMVPFEGKGELFRFQQFEYALQRGVYEFHSKEKSVRVMPGAGSFFKRQALNSIFRQHSGQRNGEDRESTLIGLKLGYKVIYIDNIVALTRPPLTFVDLVKQRIRWNLGYIETFSKEKAYYFSEMLNLSRVGIVTMFDICVVAFIILLPMTIIAISLLDSAAWVAFIAGAYVIGIAWSCCLLIKSPLESTLLRNTRILTVALFPFLKISVEYLAWLGAIISYTKRIIRRCRLSLNVKLKR